MDPINLTALVSLIVTVSLFPAYINWLKRKQIGQFIRQEGPQSHAVKAKTPTMGGLCFMLVSALTALVFVFGLRGTGAPALSTYATTTWQTASGIMSVHNWTAARLSALAVIAVAICCGLVGFIDDYGKITSQSNRGVSARTRLTIEFSLGLLLSALLFSLQAVPANLVGFGAAIPIAGVWQLVVYLVVVVPFLLASATNAINLHDGMDGLAGGTSALVFIVLFLMLALLGQIYLATICAAMVGALAGFLVFNRYRARVFMGDTGSLYIGGIMAAVVAASGLLLWFIPLALLYIAETLSVILQVTYFKLTKEWTPQKPMSKPMLLWTKLTKRLPGEGKRFFRMAPLHHHFEAVGAEKGEPEWQVVAYFWAAQFILCLLTWLLFRDLFKLN